MLTTAGEVVYPFPVRVSKKGVGIYSVRGLERSELGGSHGCPIHSAPSLGQSIAAKKE